MAVTVQGTQIVMNSGAAQVDQPGTAPLYHARAWARFNGKGTVSLLASANISSLGDAGEGYYTMSFTTDMPSINYCVVATSSWASTTTATPSIFLVDGQLTTNYFWIRSTYYASLGSGMRDAANISVVIYN